MTKKVKQNKKQDSAESLAFDEDAIKNRIVGMLDSYKKKGGVLELTDDLNDEVEPSDKSEEEASGSEKRENSDSEVEGGDDSDISDDISDSGKSSQLEDLSNDESDEEMDDDDLDEDTADVIDQDGEESEGDGEESEESGKQTNEERKKQREKKKFDFERNTRTIFVGNLPSTYDHRDVAKIFKDCGPVESSRIRSVVPDKEKLAPKVAMITKRIHPKIDSVNAYVVFKHNEDDVPIKKALALNGKLLDGHHIRVDRAIMPNSKRMTITSRKKSVFVGNLRFDIRDDDLINHFNKVGPVNYVRIVRDRATGLGKGFGFVVFNDRASVKKALELNDSSFKGRQIRIKKVDEEEKKTGKKTNTADSNNSQQPKTPAKTSASNDNPSTKNGVSFNKGVPRNFSNQRDNRQQRPANGAFKGQANHKFGRQNNESGKPFRNKFNDPKGRGSRGPQVNSSGGPRNGFRGSNGRDNKSKMNKNKTGHQPIKDFGGRPGKVNMQSKKNDLKKKMQKSKAKVDT